MEVSKIVTLETNPQLMKKEGELSTKVIKYYISFIIIIEVTSEDQGNQLSPNEILIANIEDTNGVRSNRESGNITANASIESCNSGEISRVGDKRKRTVEEGILILYYFNNYYRSYFWSSKKSRIWRYIFQWNFRKH